MVVKMAKWRPWPPLPSSKRFEATIVVRRLEGLRSPKGLGDLGRLCVEIRWKGSRGGYSLSSLRRIVKRNFTKEEGLGEDGVVVWNEEFQSVCTFSAYKEGMYHSWEVAFTVFNGLNPGSKNKRPVVATGSLNLAKYASAAEANELEISIPLSVPGGNAECSPLLSISLSLWELRTIQEPSDIVQRSTNPSSLLPGESLSNGKDEVSGIKAGLRKVKNLTSYVSAARRAKKAGHEEEGSDGRSSSRSDDTEFDCPLDTDSLDSLDEEGESDEGKEDASVPEAISYGTLAYANYAGMCYSNGSNSEDEDWIYYKNNRSEVGSMQVGNSSPNGSDRGEGLQQSSKNRILPWKKRKLRFRSPKTKGEPLLKKDYGEEGGDDIDFDRRQLSSSDESTHTRRDREEDLNRNQALVSEFGDDYFAVGSWESTEIKSRDGHLKLETQVFFASIDQRSEKAAGESACTALVAVVADWFQSNGNELPIKSQLDSLIREGSLEWRKLCEIEFYREQFPDKHFDLETVLQAKIRPISVLPEKSFIGFFHPEGLEAEESLDFLHDAMSFDSIWDEISSVRSNNLGDSDPVVFIISWNDHFFVLKVDQDAYYVIDTLGERLYEGCNQAYILKFDKDTTIRRVHEESQSGNENSVTEKVEELNNSKEVSAEGREVIISSNSENGDREDSVLCRGAESCREYIKSFLAAIPVRELQVDLKKGLMASTPLHHRLQIEFHYTQLSPATAVSLP